MDSSHLQRLPGELRNHIYELVLQRSNDIVVHLWTGTPKLLQTIETRHALALTRTCKEVRHECSPIFYESNKVILVTKPPGEQYSGEMRDEKNTRWQRALLNWLDQIGSRNCNHLSNVELNIGTSFMNTYYPSIESVWRSITNVLGLFNTGTTRVSMRTKVLWKYQLEMAFDLCLPLTEPELARGLLERAVEQQRRDLQARCREMRVAPRSAAYMRMELETCRQELTSFVSLIEIVKVNSSISSSSR